MTAGGVQRPAPKLGRLDRLKLTEPVRFYLWPATALVVIALAVHVGILWVDSLIDGAAVALLIGATAAARASAWTIPGIQAATAERDR